MIPQQTPVKNHWGNNSTTVFDFDFYIENEEQLLVTHTDLEGNVTTPTLGVDYSINSVGNTNGSSINFPLAESRYSTLAWDTSTDAKELLTISLDIPIEQPAEYNISGDLNKKNLEYSFDYLTRICQIIYRTLERTMKVSESDADFDMNLPQPKANNVFKWKEDETGLENYDIIGENNTFKQGLLQDIAAAQQTMTNTIDANKTATDEAIADFELSVNSTLQAQGQNLQDQLDTYKQSTDADLLAYKEQVNTTLSQTSTSLQTQLDEFKGTTTQEITNFETTTNSSFAAYKSQIETDIDNFKSSVESTIETVNEAAEKINDLEEAVQTAIDKADEVSEKADAVEQLATTVSQQADEVQRTASNLADKSLSNLNETGQAIIDAKLEESVFDAYVSSNNAAISNLSDNKADKTTVTNLANTVQANKEEAAENLASEKAGLIILIKGKADEETMRLIHNGMYEGVNLETKFATEIASAGSVYAWLAARKTAGNFEGINVGDYFYVSMSAGTIAGYSLAAQTFKCRIIGINTYSKCGDTVIGDMFYIKSDQCIDTPIKWNPNDNNNGTGTQNNPWLASAAYAILNGVNNYAKGYNNVYHGANGGNGIISLLPSALRSVMQQKRMLLDSRYSASGLLTCSSDWGWGWGDGGKLWLPNEIEVYGCGVRSDRGLTSGYWFPEAGLSIQFPWFANNCSNRVSTKSDGSRCSWWLSAAASNHSSHVCGVSYTGHANSYVATNAAIYLPLCFCI